MTDYDPSWFNRRAEQAAKDASLLVPDLYLAVGAIPRSVADFGCGDSALLSCFRELGTEGLIGVDAHGPPFWSVPGGLHLALDLTQPIDLHTKVDLVVCLEVAEHLPESAADTLVDTLTRHGDRVVFSAAPPGQGGTGHINEQPWGYWQEKFEARGFVCQDILRHRLSPQVSPWYRQNTRLLCRRGREVRMPRTVIMSTPYRDCFPQVRDAICDLTKSALLPHLYGVPPMGIRELGYDASIDKVRSALATDFIESPDWRDFEYALWIDADTEFRPQQAIDLLVAAGAHGWDVVSGNYSTKSKKSRIVHSAKGAVPIGPYAQPHQAESIGFGFVATSKRAFWRLLTHTAADVKRKWINPGEYIWSFFESLDDEPDFDWVDLDAGSACPGFFGEDVSFSRRCKRASVPIWIVPQIYPGHIGRKVYGVEDIEVLGG